MRAQLLAPTLLLGHLTAAYAQLPRDFDAYVARSLRDWKVPGVAVAVVKGDSTILARGYGVRQHGRPEPVTERTMFEIGSTSKAFSSALIAMLVDDGKLNWDDPVIRHLPWFEVKDAYVTRNANIRDLLSHRTGYTSNHNSLNPMSRTEVVRRTRFVDPAYGFRDRYDYSNVLYSTAGELAAAVAGRPWEVLLQDRVLEPLGMRETTTDVARYFDSTRFVHCFSCPHPKSAVGLEHVKNGLDAAMPHWLVNDSIRVIPWQSYDNGVSAGSVISNVSELSIWLKFLLGEGSYRGKRLIRAETFREMHFPQSIIRPAGWIALVDSLSPSTHFWNYGLGWRMNDYRGKKIVWHTGGIAGFLAYVGLLPEEGIGVAVLSNGDLGDELLPQSLALRIYDQVLGPPVRDWTAELIAAMKTDQARAEAAERAILAERVEGTKPSQPLERLAGRYTSDLYGEARITARDGRLFFELPGGAAGELIHWHHDVFRLRLEPRTSGGSFSRFDVGPKAQVERLVVDGLGTFRR